MSRVPVLSTEGKPLMPTKPSRARRWIKEGKAIKKFNKLGQFYVQLLVEPLNSKTQPISRRQLHLMLPSRGGLRRKYGGTVTRHGIRKGDFVKAEKAGKVFYGWCSGDTAKQVSVSDVNWKRLGQFTASKVVLLQRSTGLICKQETSFVGATVD